MTNITVCHKSRTIGLPKKDYKAASIYGNDAYNDLQAVRRDYPDYRVVELKPSKRNDPYKGLTMAYIEKYIASHDADGSVMKELNILRGKSIENDEFVQYAEAASFFEIKKWFLDKYPEIKQYSKNSRDNIKRILDAASNQAVA